MWLWVVARSALGFGGGLLLPGLRRAATVLDPPNAGKNLGRLIVGEVVGFTLGPVVAAVLVEVGGIRLPFIVAAVGPFVFVPFVARLPDDPGHRTERVTHSFDLLSRRRLQGALTLVFGYFLVLGALEAVIPLMFKDRVGGALETGIAFTTFGLPIALVSTHAGKTADRIGGAKEAMVGMTVSSAVTLAYGFASGIWPLVAVMLGAGLAALPAAAIYEAAGARTVWVWVALTSLGCLALGGLRIRGTEPVRSSAAIAEPHPPAPKI